MAERQFCFTNLARTESLAGDSTDREEMNIDAIGAEIKYQAGDLTVPRSRWGSAAIFRITIRERFWGLGKHEAIDWVEVKWHSPAAEAAILQGCHSIDTSRY